MLTEREQRDLMARVDAETDGHLDFILPLTIDLQVLMVIVANLQLASRHPGNVGNETTRGIIDAIIQSVEAAGFIALAQLMKLGNDPAYDGFELAPPN